MSENISLAQKTKKITIRIRQDKGEEWEKYREENNFETMSSFIRTAVNEYIIRENEEGSGYARIIEEGVIKMDKKIQELLEEQKMIVKVIASKIESPSHTPYQKGIVINLLTESPRDIDELNIILDDLSKPELIVIVNDLLEANIIEINENHKYYVLK